MEDKVEEKFLDGSGMTGGQRLKLFFRTHYRGLLLWLIPIILLPIVARKGVEKWEMAIYIYLIMSLCFLTRATYIGAIAMFPIFMYPLLGVYSTIDACKCYFNDINAILMCYTALNVGFQASKLDRRLVFCMIRMFGVSHERLLLGISFASMVMASVLNTYSASMLMAPIVQEILQTLFEANVTPNPIERTEIPTDLTAYYHIMAANSVSIGGIGMLFGSITNYCIRANFNVFYEKAPDAQQFTLLKFSLFTIPAMVLLVMMNYLYTVIVWIRRPILAAPFNADQKAATKLALKKKREELGPITFHEWVFSILYILTIALSFSRMPGMFRGWGEIVQETFEPPKKNTTDIKPPPIEPKIINYFRDSPVIALGMILAFMIPRNIHFLRMCGAKKKEDLPAPITTPGLITWKLFNTIMPWDILFLLGCNVAIARASERSKLTEKISSAVRSLGLSLVLQWVLVVFFVIIPMLLANLAPNASVATVLIPLAIQVGKGIDLGPVVLPLATGLACAMTFMCHVGSPALHNTNKVVKLPASKVLKVGVGTTIIAIGVLLFVLYIHAEIFWDVFTPPVWSKPTTTTTPAPAG